jgi:hypothetical protein
VEASQSWADQAIQALEIEHPKQAAYVQRRRDWTKQYGFAMQPEPAEAEQTA